MDAAPLSPTVIMRESAIGLFLSTGLAATSSEPDERLLADFFAHRDERAFAAIVRRHQRTVWGVCKRLLNNSADAEDAFQATFLVLVCRGRTLAERGSVGGWLCRVAHRIALKARTMANKRRLREERAAKSDGFLPDESSDLMVVVGEELERLPENHRLAVIVCDLDGLSRTKAAERLGCSEGTLSSRLHRGRKELAERLKIRGITVPLAGLGALFVAVSPAPASLGSTTVGLAQTVSVLGISNRAVSATVAALVSQTTREMVMRFTTKVLAAIALSSGLIGGGWLGWNPGAPSALQAAPVPVVKGEGKVELPASAFELLRMRKVLKELKCTPEQRVNIEDAFDELSEKAPAQQAFAVRLNGGNAGNIQAIQAQLEEQSKKQREEAEVASKTIGEKHLKKDQLIRLGQILIQSKGIKAFTDEKIADELKLSDDQKKAVGAAIRDLEAPAAEEQILVPQIAPGGGPLPGNILFGRVNGLADSGMQDPKKRAAALEKIVEGLTKDQQTTWKKLTGEKIGFGLPTELLPGGLSTIRFGAQLFAPALPAAPLPPEKP